MGSAYVWIMHKACAWVMRRDLCFEWSVLKQTWILDGFCNTYAWVMQHFSIDYAWPFAFYMDYVWTMHGLHIDYAMQLHMDYARAMCGLRPGSVWIMCADSEVC